MSTAGDAIRLLTPRRGEERSARRLSYGSGERAFQYVLLSLVVVEGVGLFMLLRGTWFGWPIAVADALSLPWLLGMIAGTRSYPHLVLPDRLVLRSGPRVRLDIPLADVTALRPHFRTSDDPKPRLDGDRVLLPSGGSTNLEVTLAQQIATPFGPARAVGFAVDEKVLRSLQAEPLPI